MQNVGLFNLIALTIKIIEPRQCEAECRLPPSSQGNQNQVVSQLHQSPALLECNSQRYHFQTQSKRVLV